MINELDVHVRQARLLQCPSQSAFVALISLVGAVDNGLH
jgi:hypothetical protein